MDSVLDIVPFAERRYEEIPVDKIRVINSRNREPEQFEMNVQSIDQVGLLKPVRVNDKFLERTGLYELICGEGRVLAHQKLGRQTVLAEVITCTRKEAYLQSLIENLARTKPDSMHFARELKRLHDEGWDYKQIGRVACKSESFIREYIRLVEQGEDPIHDPAERDQHAVEGRRVAATAPRRGTGESSRSRGGFSLRIVRREQGYDRQRKTGARAGHSHREADPADGAEGEPETSQTDRGQPAGRRADRASGRVPPRGREPTTTL